MKGKIVNLVMLMLAVGLFATPARADTLVKVTVRGPDGGPAAGVAVTIRQAAGYASAAGDVEPPAVVAAAATGGDGTVNLRLAGVRPYDVYSIGADDRASGRYASTAVFAGESRWPTPILTLDNQAPAINLERTAGGRGGRELRSDEPMRRTSEYPRGDRTATRSIAALGNAIAQYARASAALPALGPRRGYSSNRGWPRPTARRRFGTTCMLRLLAENMRAGLDADRRQCTKASPRSSSARTGPEAGVEMLALSPGWQVGPAERRSVELSSAIRRHRTRAELARRRGGRRPPLNDQKIEKSSGYPAAATCLAITPTRWARYVSAAVDVAVEAARRLLRRLEGVGAEVGGEGLLEIGLAEHLRPGAGDGDADVAAGSWRRRRRPGRSARPAAGTWRRPPCPASGKLTAVTISPRPSAVSNRPLKKSSAAILRLLVTTVAPRPTSTAG